MKRASRILTLILIVVFLFGIFAGCDLVGKNTANYRKTKAINVGGQSITVGKLLDTFNSYYNNYYYYIAYGQLTVDDVLDLAIQSLVSQYMKVDSYVSNDSNVKVSDNKNKYALAEYLTQDQLDYVVSYVTYLVFQSFDGNVLEKVEAKYELKAEEVEDTSRDFYKYDDLKGATTYAEYYRDQNFRNEEMDEYLEKYYQNNAKALLDHSNLLDLYQQSAEAKVKELNERLDKDPDDDDTAEITTSEYQDLQKSVFNQYATSVKNSYAITFDEFLKLQIEDMIVSSITVLYNYDVYKEIEKDDDFKKTLEKNYETNKAAQVADFEIANNFDSYVTGLSSTSFIYDVPSKYAEDYVFVKNILIPFSEEQTARLNSLKADLGTTDSDLYVNYRNTLAGQIVADDFDTAKNDDGEYGKLEENPFVFEDGEVKVNPECTELSAYLAGGNVTAMEGKSVDETIVELMKRFNTDVAQHSAQYSYVVYVGDNENYKHQWVDEFVQATKDAMASGEVGHYGIGVSDYGVHIVYVEGYVKADDVDFNTANYLKTDTVEYRLFKTYFEKQVNKLIADKLEALQEQYVEKDITATKVFAKFLKENGLEYDLIARLSKNEDK